MPKQKRRRKTSTQRNLLYEEPSPWAALVILGIIVMILVIALLIGFHLLPSYSDFVR